ncbi:MAG: hypothetical protein ACXW5U_01215 [Thermoanaerobaculia bacterium]
MQIFLHFRVRVKPNRDLPVSLRFRDGAARRHPDAVYSKQTRHLLDQTSRSRAPEPVAANTKLFDHFVGRYELAPSFILTVTREGERLFAQATGQPKFEIFPKSDVSTF